MSSAAAASSFRYTLAGINSIAHKGFDYEIPENVMDIIIYLAGQVGHTGSIGSPVFKKKDASQLAEEVNKTMNNHGHHNNNNNHGNNNRRKKGNKASEISDAEWESLRTFQPTKMAEKVGIAIHIDNIRSNLNKITDKLYDKLKPEIIEILNTVMLENYSEEEINKLGTIIFDTCTSNKAYSKVYAQLYKELAERFTFLRKTFDISYESFKSLFDNIEFIEPEVNYDKFCEINKVNMKRRALSQFLVNLAHNKFLDKVEIIKLNKHLLSSILDLIHKEGNKPIIDEITENVAILYDKEIIDSINLDDDELTIDNDNIVEVVTKISLMKVKDYKSLTNKSVFKFMDLFEM